MTGGYAVPGLVIGKLENQAGGLWLPGFFVARRGFARAR